jgi:hypothetical protein
MRTCKELTKRVTFVFKICGKETFLVLSTTRWRRTHGGKQTCITLLIVKFTEVILSFTPGVGGSHPCHRRLDVTTERQFVYTRYRIRNTTPHSGILPSFAGRAGTGATDGTASLSKVALRHITLKLGTAFFSVVTALTGQMTATNLSTRLSKRWLKKLHFAPSNLRTRCGNHQQNRFGPRQILVQ